MGRNEAICRVRTWALELGDRFSPHSNACDYTPALPNRYDTDMAAAYAVLGEELYDIAAEALGLAWLD